MSPSKEPLLQENKNRFSLLPVAHKELWDQYKKAESGFWTAEEIDLSNDLGDFESKLTDNEKIFLKNILAYFALESNVAAECLAVSFLSKVQWMEARCFYGFQIVTENIHAESFTLLLDTLVKDRQEKDRLLNAKEKIAVIREKADWLIKHAGSDGFAEGLVAFAAAKQIFSSTGMGFFTLLRDRQILPGLVYTTDLVSRDEKIHADFTSQLFHKLTEKPSAERITQIITDAVALEKKFIQNILTGPVNGVPADAFDRYAEFTADRLLASLGCRIVYNVVHPFDVSAEKKSGRTASISEQRAAEFRKIDIRIEE